MKTIETRKYRVKVFTLWEMAFLWACIGFVLFLVLYFGTATYTPQGIVENNLWSWIGMGLWLGPYALAALFFSVRYLYQNPPIQRIGKEERKQIANAKSEQMEKEAGIK